MYIQLRAWKNWIMVWDIPREYCKAYSISTDMG
jgi:hypothetical protein